jgi:hypothetical protein
MPSLPHEGLLDVFRNRPSLAPELLQQSLQAELPPFERVAVADPNVTDLSPAEFRADLVLLLEGAQGRPPLSALVVEVQLQPDTGKRWSWPVYIVGLRARLRCDVGLVVVTDSTSVATWASSPIPTGHPGFTLTPLVLGPASVPEVRDEVAAEQSPELAVLSAVLHGAEPESVEISKAAIHAARHLDRDRAALYIDLVLASANAGARAVLEALMMSKNYQYQSDFAKRYVAKGRAEAVLQVLATRGIPVPPDVRDRIAQCTDDATLVSWLDRAVTVTSVSELFVS